MLPKVATPLPVLLRVRAPRAAVLLPVRTVHLPVVLPRAAALLRAQTPRVRLQAPVRRALLPVVRLPVALPAPVAPPPVIPVVPVNVTGTDRAPGQSVKTRTAVGVTKTVKAVSAKRPVTDRDRGAPVASIVMGLAAVRLPAQAPAAAPVLPRAPVAPVVLPQARAAALHLPVAPAAPVLLAVTAM